MEWIYAPREIAQLRNLITMSRTTEPCLKRSTNAYISLIKQRVTCLHFAEEWKVVAPPLFFSCFFDESKLSSKYSRVGKASVRKTRLFTACNVLFLKVEAGVVVPMSSRIFLPNDLYFCLVVGSVYGSTS